MSYTREQIEKAVKAKGYVWFEDNANKGYDVNIINLIRQNPTDQINPHTEYCQKLIKTINNGNYDFVHIHYDCLFHTKQCF